MDEAYICGCGSVKFNMCKNGLIECAQCNKHIQTGRWMFIDNVKQLMNFYDAETIDKLIEEQEQHIVRLQAQVPPRRDNFPPSYRRG